MIKIFKHQGPALLWALFILIICNIRLGPVSESPLFFEGFDKLTHCGLFFVMTVLITRGLIRRYLDAFTYGKAFQALAISVVFGALIEVLQVSIFTWRTGDWEDLFCDVVGAAMGTFAILVTFNAAKYAKI